MGGGGGDGGYAAKQQQIENQKTSARAVLNALFGVSTPAPAAAPQTQAVYGRGMSMVDGEADRMPIDTSQGDTAASNKTARDAIYQQVRDNAFTAGKRAVDERKTTAARQNKFALFAQGLNGGSEDIDQNAMLQRTYNQGLLDVGAKADASKADMQSSDEQTRLSLLQSIDNGMDQGSALSSALGQMKVNSDRATAQAQGQTVGDLFGNAGLLYMQSQAAKGRAAGRYAYPQLFGTNAKPASMGGGSGGIITPT